MLENRLIFLRLHACSRAFTNSARGVLPGPRDYSVHATVPDLEHDTPMDRLGLTLPVAGPLWTRPVEAPRQSKGGSKKVPENFEAGSEQPSYLEAVGLQQAGR